MNVVAIARQCTTTRKISLCTAFKSLTISANSRAFVDSSTSVAAAGRESEVEADSMDHHSIISKLAQVNRLSDKDNSKLNSIIQSSGSDVKDKLSSIESKTLFKQEWDATDDIIAKQVINKKWTLKLIVYVGIRLSLLSICNLISPTTFDVLKDKKTHK
ncbi:MAG: hypothetical protein EXX96DRAFT_542370 [Benjaminiella poitrasii]|nr:MAG: hypothetical protein EXX96DRAFT_542370 [Benjaminiella poitrasii]